MRIRKKKIFQIRRFLPFRKKQNGNLDDKKLNLSPKLIIFMFLGWLYKLKVKNAAELKELLSEAEYESFKKADEAQH